MRVVITGANGLLGQNLTAAGLSAGHEVVGMDLQPVPFRRDDGLRYLSRDLTTANAFQDLLHEAEPEWVIHTAAFTNVDGAEKQESLCRRINHGIVEELVDACKATGTRLLHVSTDYVFDGTAGPYRETDPIRPLGVYASSKAAGEEAVTAADLDWVVVRPNVLYGHGIELKSSFVHWLIGELRQGNSVRIVNDQFNNPTYARRMADFCFRLIQEKALGIWHFGCREVISRYDFALQIAAVFELPSGLIQAVDTASLGQAAPRPMKSGLICEKAANKLKFPILAAREELSYLKEEMNGA